MLTRLEVQGFKNLVDVAVDFCPFTCIAGTNGIGKSNVFDAIEFLAHLAGGTLPEAAQRVRSAADGRSGDLRDLFWRGQPDHERRISLAAEMIVPGEVEDDAGGLANPGTTLLRYEVELGYEPELGEAVPGRLTVHSEYLRPIPLDATRCQLRFPHSSVNFSDVVLKSWRSANQFIEVDVMRASRLRGSVVTTLREGGRRRLGRRVFNPSTRTVLSTVTTNDYPTILAARREMQSWRRLALEPSALRAVDDLSDPRVFDPTGRHLAATLYRIAHEPVDGMPKPEPEAVYARVAGRLADLTGARVDGVEVDLDPARETFTLYLRELNGPRLPARALSEGTLRFLALCVLLEDPTADGLLCMEEPENGIHPANLPAMIQVIRDIAVDPFERVDATNPLRQVFINTHSPGVVQLCETDELLLADVRPQRLPDGRIVRGLTLLPYRDSWRAQPGQPTFSEADMVAYLTAPPQPQLRLPEDLSRQ